MAAVEAVEALRHIVANAGWMDEGSPEQVVYLTSALPAVLLSLQGQRAAMNGETEADAIEWLKSF